MACLTECCNNDIICELCKAIGKNVVVFTEDQFVYYAKLERIVNNRIALLSPGLGESGVIVRLAGQQRSESENFWCRECSDNIDVAAGVVHESFSYVDICSIVAVSIGLEEVPANFAISDYCERKC